MKKLLFVGLAALGTFTLTGCQFLDNIIDTEQSYSNADYKVMLAERDLKFDYTKATATFDVDGEKSTREYTYDKDDATWKYPDTIEVLGVEIESDSSEGLDIVSDIKSFEVLGALFSNVKVTYYAKKTSYRITATYRDDSSDIEAEYKYGSNGLRTSSYTKKTNLTTVKATKTTVTYSYSK